MSKVVLEKKTEGGSLKVIDPGGQNVDFALYDGNGLLLVWFQIQPRDNNTVGIATVKGVRVENPNESAVQQESKPAGGLKN